MYGSAAAKSGSTVCGATSPREKPSPRLGQSRSKRTSSVSPGCAPSTKNGPVCGLPPGWICSRRWSRPPASTHHVSIVSPSATLEHRLVRADRRVEVLRVEGVLHVRCASASSRSLSPRPERQTTITSPSSSAARASAWAGSSAGMIPSVSASRRKASSASSSVARDGTRRGPCRGGKRAPARRRGSRGRPRSSARRRSGRPRRRAARSARRAGRRFGRCRGSPRRPPRRRRGGRPASSRKPANIPIAFEPPPTQAIAASGSRPSASRICSRASRPITAWSSRTISG